MPKQIQDMTEDELLDAKSQKNTERAKLREDALEIQAELDRRVAREKVDALSDEEKRQIVQVINAEGIESKEKTGKAGGA